MGARGVIPADPSCHLMVADEALLAQVVSLLTLKPDLLLVLARPLLQEGVHPAALMHYSPAPAGSHGP